MRLFLFLIVPLLLVPAVPGNAQDSSEAILRALRGETLENVQSNILPFWERHAPDPRGGFYGTLGNDGTPVPGDPKGGVLNARILWTFSRAYELFGKEEYRALADRAQAYFLRHFIDPEFGGTYWSVRADGSPLDTEKQTYGIAFGIYGLAAHSQATGSEESLQAAIGLYRTLEAHAFDPVNGGYVESFTRDWQTPERFGYDGEGTATKTMNTHLHVLEAYTQLYRVWPDAGLERQLRAVVDLFLNRILDRETWHQRLFLTDDWVNLEHIDSYGHDMELSWLLPEAAEALGDEPLIREIRAIALHLVDTQMREGWNKDGSLLYERKDGQVTGGLEWWPQAESVVGFFHAWQISADPRYLEAADKTWTWIRENLVDEEYGEWYGGLGPDGRPNTRRPKVNLWKCPYHNSRMAFELNSL
ncbi:MAG: AGE family epimerase/isomerase [Bacteroidales bacterium]